MDGCETYEVPMLVVTMQEEEGSRFLYHFYVTREREREEEEENRYIHKRNFKGKGFSFSHKQSLLSKS